jgi:hypothetical protein
VAVLARRVQLRAVRWLRRHGPRRTRAVLAVQARWRTPCVRCPYEVRDIRDASLRRIILASHVARAHGS